jgi:DsbC/DsbD-like thiol-disulfide interchange protein
MNKILSVLAAGFVLFSSASVMAAATAPRPGLYHALQYAASVSGSDCNVTVGQTYTSTWYWPGPGKTGTKEWIQSTTDSGGPELKIHSFPKTPNKGVTKWSGTETGVTIPPSIKDSSNFNGTLTFADANSFMITITFKFDNCTETLAETFVLQGLQ